MAIPGFAESSLYDAPHTRVDVTRIEVAAHLIARVEREYRPAVYACSFSAEDGALVLPYDLP